MRNYPDRHPPGSFWATDEAYAILDALPDGVLDDLQYAYISGLIAGVICRYAGEERPPGWGSPKPMPKMKK